MNACADSWLASFYFMSFLFVVCSEVVEDADANQARELLRRFNVNVLINILLYFIMDVQYIQVQFSWAPHFLIFVFFSYIGRYHQGKT